MRPPANPWWGVRSLKETALITSASGADHREKSAVISLLRAEFSWHNWLDRRPGSCTYARTLDLGQSGHPLGFWECDAFCVRGARAPGPQCQHYRLANQTAARMERLPGLPGGQRFSRRGGFPASGPLPPRDRDRPRRRLVAAVPERPTHAPADGIDRRPLGALFPDRRRYGRRKAAGELDVAVARGRPSDCHEQVRTANRAAGRHPRTAST